MKKLLSLLLVLLSCTAIAGQPVTDTDARAFTETATPPTIANTGWLWSADDSGDTELFWKDDSGATLQMTKDGAIPGSSIADVLKLDQTTPQTITGTPTIKATTANGTTNILYGIDSGSVERVVVDSNGATTITSDTTSGYALSVVDNRSTGYSNILSFLAPLAPSGTVMTFGTDATHNSSWTWDRTTSMMAYQTYGNAYPFEFQGSYSHFAAVNGSKFLNAPTGVGGTEYARMDNSTKTFAIGTTDLDGTPAIGRIVAEGLSSDGSTNIIVGRDSSHSNVFVVDTNGAITGADLTTNKNIGTVIGSNDWATNTDCNSWTLGVPDEFIVTNLGGGSGSDVTQEDVIFNSAPYSIKIYGGTGGTPDKILFRNVTGLTPGSSYGFGMHLRREAGVSTQVQLIILDSVTSPTKQWYNDPYTIYYTGSSGAFTQGDSISTPTGNGYILEVQALYLVLAIHSGTFSNGQTLTSGLGETATASTDAVTSTAGWFDYIPANPVSDSKTLSSDGFHKEGIIVTVPASGEISLAWFAEDNKTFYLDDVLAATITIVNGTVFDFINGSDFSALTASDNVFDFRSSYGSGFSALKMGGTGAITTDFSAINFADNVSITNSKTLTVGNDSFLSDTEVDLITNNLSGASSNYISHLFDESARTTAISFTQAGSVATPVATAGYKLNDSLVITSADNVAVNQATIQTASLAAGVVSAANRGITKNDIMDNAGALVGSHIAQLFDGNGNSKAAGYIIDNRSFAFDAGVISVGNDLILESQNTYGATQYGASVTLRAADATGTGDLDGGSINLDLGLALGSGQDGVLNLLVNNVGFGAIAKEDAHPLIVGLDADGATAVGVTLGALNDLSTSGSKLVSFKDNILGGGVEKLYIDKDGSIVNNSGSDFTIKVPAASVGKDITVLAGINTGASNSDGANIRLLTTSAFGTSTNGQIFLGETDNTGYGPYYYGYLSREKITGNFAIMADYQSVVIGTSTYVPTSYTPSSYNLMQVKYGINTATPVTVAGINAEGTFTTIGGRIVGTTTVNAASMIYTPAYLTGGSSATTDIPTWQAVTDGSFAITIDGQTLSITGLNFTTATTMLQVASRIQSAIQTAMTAPDATCTWVTDHFVITSTNTTSASAVSVTSATGSGTDISGAGATPFMDAETGVGTPTAAVLTPYYTLATDDNILHVTYTATGSITITLPTAQTDVGRIITVKDAGGAATTNNITVATEGAEKIDGVDTAVISTNYDSLDIYSDGTNWFIK